MQFACKRRVLASSLISGQIWGALNVPQDAEIWTWTHCLTDVIIVYSTYPEILTTKTNWSSNDTSFLFFKYERSIHLHFFPTDKQKNETFVLLLYGIKMSECMCCAHFVVVISGTSDYVHIFLVRMIIFLHIFCILWILWICVLLYIQC